MSGVSYDPKCFDLARDFLEDEAPFTPEEVVCLAQIIQTAIEDYLEHWRKKPDANPRGILPIDKRSPKA